MIFKSPVSKSKAQQYLDALKAVFEQSVLPEQAQSFSFAVVNTHGVRLDFGESATTLESVAICYRTEKNALVSLFSPFSEFMQVTPDFAQFMENGRLHGSYLSKPDLDEIRRAFGWEESVMPWLIDHVYEPTEKDINNSEYIRVLLSTLISRLFMDVELGEMAKDGPLDSPSIPRLLSPEQRPLQLEIEYRLGDGASRNIMGLPVRDDYILTLSCTDSAATRRGMNRAKIFFLQVSGYIDFRLAPMETSNSKPWNPVRERYVPEFIVTAINQVSGANVAEGSIAGAPLHDIQANFISMAMVTKFMRSGAWVERFAKELGSGPNNVLALAPKDLAESVATAVRGETNEIARVFNQLLEPGFMVSMDVDSNALDDYSMAPMKLTMHDPDYLGKVALPLLRYTFSPAHSFGNGKPKLSDFQESRSLYPVQRAGLFVDKGFYSRMEFGRLSRQQMADIRYIDALAAFYLSRQDPLSVSKYMDAFYPANNGGFSPPNPMDKNRKFRREFQKEQTDVVYTGVAERVTIAPEFLQEVQCVIEQYGGTMTVMMSEPRRPTAYMSSMNAF